MQQELAPLNQQEQKQINSLRSQIQTFEFSTINNIQTITKGILLQGNTRAGKSTLFIASKEVPMISMEIQQIIDPVYDALGSQHKNKIGHKYQSHTKIPNICRINGQENPYLIDCPGLMDTQGFKDIVSNSYFINRVFKLISKARFVLCIQQSDLKAANKSNVNGAINGFLKYFKNPGNLSQIIKKTSLVVTKCEENQNRIIKHIEATKKTFLDKNFTNHSQLLNHFLTNNQIFYFQRAKQSGKQPSLEEMSIAKKVAEKQFYDINFERDISFELDTTDTNQNMRKSMRLIKLMSKQLQKILKQLCVLLKNTLVQFSDNVKKSRNQQTRQYKNKIINFVKEKDIYSSKEIINQRKLKLGYNKVIFDLSKNEFLDLMLMKEVKIIVDSSSDDQSKMNQTVKNNCLCYIQFILNYGYLQGENVDEVYSLGYISQRLFEQQDILKRILPSLVISYRDLYDTLISSLLNIRIDELQNSFIVNYNVPANSQFNNIQAIREFFNPQNLVNPDQDGTYPPIFQNVLCINQNPTRPQDIQNKRKQILANCSLQMGLIYLGNNNRNQGLTCLEESRIFFQTLYSQFNQTLFTKFNQKLYKTLAETYFQSNQYKLAIQYFKIINYENQVILSYQRLINSLNSSKDKINNLIQYARYLASICYPQQAKKKLSQAFQLSSEATQRCNIKNLISQILTNQQTAKNNYISKIANKDYYNKPQAQKIEELKKLIKN